MAEQLYTVDPGLYEYNYRGTMHTGTFVKYFKRGSTAKTTVVVLRPSYRFKGEPKYIHRFADKIRKVSKPILGPSTKH